MMRFADKHFDDCPTSLTEDEYDEELNRRLEDDPFFDEDELERDGC